MPLTFGAVGDIITLSTLIKDLVKALSDSRGSAAEYHATICKLQSIDQALVQVEALFSSYEHMVELEDVHPMATNCIENIRKTIAKFQARINPYEANLSATTSGVRIKGAASKVRWRISEKQTRAEFRAGVQSHCSAINCILYILREKITVLENAETRRQLEQAHTFRQTASAKQSTMLEPLSNQTAQTYLLLKTAVLEVRRLKLNLEFDALYKTATNIFGCLQRLYYTTGARSGSCPTHPDRPWRFPWAFRFPVGPWSTELQFTAMAFLFAISLYKMTRRVRLQSGEYSAWLEFINTWSLLFFGMMMVDCIPILSISARVKVICVRAFRPPVPENYERITWNCDCGKELYGDFTTSDPSALVDLEHAISPVVSASAQPMVSPSAPAQAHIRELPAPDCLFLEVSSISGTLPAVDNNSRALCNTLVPRYFELCVNTGEFSQTLGEIDVTRITDDNHFFRRIQGEYRKIRGHRMRKYYLLKPIAMQFVRFCVQDGHRINILEKDSFPSEEDVARQDYHYSPCPLKTPPPMPSDAFMHYMKCEYLRKRSIWLSRLPKKLSCSITRSIDDLPIAWGVHIIEGPDKVNILFTLICALSICTAPLIGYVVKTGDVSGATGIGSVLVTALTLLWMSMKIQQWRDE